MHDAMEYTREDVKRLQDYASANAKQRGESAASQRRRRLDVQRACEQHNNEHSDLWRMLVNAALTR